jgi:hypothetical protein
MKNEKAQGSFAELQFASKATEHGAVVSMPFNDTALYDFVIDIDGSLYRVQVKSAFRDDACGVSLQHGKSKPGRLAPDIQWDLLAAYRAKNDSWYLVPSFALTAGTSYSFKEQHREAWEDFGLTVLAFPGLCQSSVPAPTTSHFEKRCPRCGITQSVIDFSRNASKSDGRQSECKTCRRMRKQAAA